MDNFTKEDLPVKVSEKIIRLGVEVSYHPTLASHTALEGPWRAKAYVKNIFIADENREEINYCHGAGSTREKALDDLRRDIIAEYGMELFVSVEKVSIEFSTTGWKETADGV